MEYDADKLLDGLPNGSYVLSLDADGLLVATLVYSEEQEWLPDEMPFTLPMREAA